MKYTGEQLFIFFAFLPTLIASVTALVRYKYLDKSLKNLAQLVFFALSIEIISRVFWLYKVSNLFLWPLYISVEFGLLLWIYSRELNIRFLKRGRVAIILVFCAYIVYRTLHASSKITQIDNGGRLLESIVVLLLVMAYFSKLYAAQPLHKLWNNAMFGVSAGLFIFFSGNFLIFLFINFILQYSQKLNYQVWVIHGILNGILYLSYTFALWKNRES